MLHQEKKLPNDSGKPLSYNDLTDKNKMAVTKKQCFLFYFILFYFILFYFIYLFFFFCVFCIELRPHLLSFKVRGLQMTIIFSLV